MADDLPFSGASLLELEASLKKVSRRLELESLSSPPPSVELEPVPEEGPKALLPIPPAGLPHPAFQSLLSRCTLHPCDGHRPAGLNDLSEEPRVALDRPKRSSLKSFFPATGSTYCWRRKWT